MSQFQIFAGKWLRMRWAPFALAAALLLPSLYWIWADQSAWSYDPSWYGEVSADLWNSFIGEGKWKRELVYAFQIKAPGLAWFGEFFMPVGRAAGSVEFGLLLFVWLTQLASLFLSIRISRQLWPTRPFTHFLAPLFLASAPLFVAMTHQYFVEPLQTLGVLYFYWLAVGCEGWSKPKVIVHLVLATCLAMLAKITSPIYCAGPGLIAAASIFSKSAPWKPASRKELVESTALFFFAVLLSYFTFRWYVKSWGPLTEFFKTASSGPAALDYGSAGSLWDKSRFWLRAARKSFFLPVVGWAWAASLLAFFLINVRPWRGAVFRPTRLHLVVAAALAHVALTLITLSSNINEETRYLLPMLPSLAIAALAILAPTRGKALPFALMLALAAQWGLAHGMALNFAHRDGDAQLQANNGLGITNWLLGLERDGRKKAELQRLARCTAAAGLKDEINICGVEFAWFNANTLSFISAQQRGETGFRMRYTSLGYAEKDFQKAWDRLLAMNPSFFISIDESAQPQPPNFVNQVSLPILKMIRADPSFVAEPFPSQLGILVFRNTRRLP